MKSIIITLTLLLSTTVLAAPISALRDWSAEKDVTTALGETGCIAETIFTDVANDGTQTKWILQVAKLRSRNGDYSTPTVVAFPEATITEDYFEAKAQSDRNGADEFSMTLMQPEKSDVNVVGSRIVDRVEMIRRLKADNKFTVDFLSKDKVIQKVEFSLSGSSRTISNMEQACQ